MKITLVNLEPVLMAMALQNVSFKGPDQIRSDILMMERLIASHWLATPRDLRQGKLTGMASCDIIEPAWCTGGESGRL